MKLLLIEDDKYVATALSEILKEHNYAVDLATDGEAGWDYASTYTYDLILLDVQLPKLDGINLCQRLRNRGYCNPILLLTARNKSTDKIQGLNAGADDYIVKPFDLEELLARIRALLRREPQTLPLILRWGSLSLHPNTYKVTYKEENLNLTPKQYGLLELFMSHPQRVFSPGIILDRLWPSDEVPGEDAVRTHIKELRQKLKAAGAPSDLIKTVYGQGYCLGSCQKEEELSSKYYLLESLLDNLGHETEVIPEIENTHFQPGLLIINKDSEFTDRLIEEARANGMRTSTAPTVKAARDLLERKIADVMAIEVSFKNGCHSESLALIEELASQTPPLPTIAISDRGNFSDRLEFTRRGGHTFLEKPLTPTQVIEAVEGILKTKGIIKTKVMFVDDDRKLLKQLPILLKPWGFQISTSDNPQEFWDLLNKVRPDLLVLDIEMPEVNGLELYQMLRASPHWRKLPVLFLSDRSDDSHTKERAFASGTEDYLSKPFVPEELANQIINRLKS
ncbi:MAG: response regulator [Prochloraceae cyanobacterium]|nr:response regulator [Prochloraceae cyanobacterium]